MLSASPGAKIGVVTLGVVVPVEECSPIDSVDVTEVVTLVLDFASLLAVGNS